MTTEPATLDLPLVPPPGGEVLYQSARATVIWGDCRDPTIITTVPNHYGLLCTDPPYGVGWNPTRETNGKREHSFGKLAGDDGTVDWPHILGQWARRLANNRHVYVFGYSSEELTEPLALGPTADLIWDKDMRGLGNLSQPWGPQHERIVFGVSSANPAHGGRGRGGGLSARLRKGSVLRVRRKNATAVTRHPTEKPVRLMSQLIESSTVQGDLVVDPCAGSGSTLVAAVLIGRHGFGVEYDRGYAELMVQRVKAAELIADQIGKC